MPRQTSQRSRWEGWTLEYSDYSETRIKLGKPLGDLTSSEQDGLRQLLGEARFNALSSYQEEICVRHPVESPDDVASRCEAFEITTSVVREYSAHKRSEAVLEYVDDVTEEEMDQIARSMIAAGIVAVPRK